MCERVFHKATINAIIGEVRCLRVRELCAGLWYVRSHFDEHAPKPGYAAGNILNMLVHLGADLTGYDFSGLAVWQAYLQETELHDMCFNCANLAHSIFVQPFGMVLSVAFSPNGDTFAAGTSDGQVRVWQMSDLQQLLSIQGHEGWTQSIAYSPDGQVLASGGDCVISEQKKSVTPLFIRPIVQPRCLHWADSTKTPPGFLVFSDDLSPMFWVRVAVSCNGQACKR